MKILLVTRGSQGDIYPYLRLSAELVRRGHTVTLSLPKIFEPQAKETGVNYTIQGKDDIGGMMENHLGTKYLLEWTRRVIDQQFSELIPLLAEHDVLVASNTEFGAPSIAEYHKKPLIRTAYGPFIPSKKIPPPVMPWPEPHPVFKPAFLWSILNMGLNMMAKKTVNKNRALYSLPPIKDQSVHAPANAFNYLMYSPSFGSVDNDWPYRWAIGGYVFNDELSYDKSKYDTFLEFLQKDKKKTLFFTLGSCNTDAHERFTRLLYRVCNEHEIKLAIGSGWHQVGSSLTKADDIFFLDFLIPHCLVFPLCDAIIHHGGAGTSHNCARAGKPQMMAPLFLDQFYWGRQVKLLGVGPERVTIKNISYNELEKKVLDLLYNESYAQNAAALGEKVRAEKGLDAICEHIEKT
jgi:UDP:flavonoid glycosyltransferase YjiC (YdhE family)